MSNTNLLSIPYAFFLIFCLFQTYRLINLSTYRFTRSVSSRFLCYTGIQQPIEYLSITALLPSLSFAPFGRTLQVNEKCVAYAIGASEKNSINQASYSEIARVTLNVRVREWWKARRVPPAQRCRWMRWYKWQHRRLEFDWKFAFTKRQDKVASSLPLPLYLSLFLSLFLALSKLRQQKLLASDSCQIDVAREPKTILRHFEL